MVGVANHSYLGLPTFHHRDSLKACSLSQNSMGMCWCKKKNEERECYLPRIIEEQNEVVVANHSPSTTPQSQRTSKSETKPQPEVSVVDKLILDTLGIIETLVDK